MSRPWLRSRDATLYLGIAAWLVGAVLLRDAYDRRGRKRPIGLKLGGAVLG